MASISGVSGSNTVSSLMNSANTITGLASGLDTESMIENLVKGYQTKITQLSQKVAKTEWKQDAYRSIISKMVGFSSKYTSYTSSTNLMSPGFFSGAVKVLTKGDFADSVSASGKTSSDIQLNAVHQLARAAQYRTKSNLDTGTVGSIAADGEFDLFKEGQINLSNLSGSLSLAYGSKTVSISFSENGDVDLMKDIRAKLAKEQDISGDEVEDAEVLAELINQKLADEKIVFTNGNAESADQRIRATAKADGSIVFEELGTGKNGLYISKASGNIAQQFGLSEEDLEEAEENKITAIDTDSITGGLTRSMSAINYLAEKGATTMNLSLDGSTKQITTPSVGYDTTADGDELFYLNGKEVEATYKEDGSVDKTAKQNFIAQYTEALQKSVNDAFKGKVTVENQDETGENLRLKFKVKNEGSELVINTDVGDALGIGRSAASYLSTGKKLGDLLKTDGDGGLDGLTAVQEKDEDGNMVDKLDDKGKKQYDFVINGVKIGTFTEDSKLSDVLSAINSNKEAGVQASYSQTTQNFTFTSKETGSDSEIEMGEGLAQAMFGSTNEHNFVTTSDGKGEILVDAEGNKVHGIDKDGNEYYIKRKIGDDKYLKCDEHGRLIVGSSETSADDPLLKKYRKGYTAGQDAKFTVTVNGEKKDMVRSTNSVNIDGLTINMDETFNTKEAAAGDKYGFEVKETNKSVTFQNKTDSDKIIDAIKSMVNDYNTMMTEIKSAYSTMPYQKSSGTFADYEPLTEDERDGMSESAIERYEEKAKQGILFGDRNLSNLYTKMNQAFSFSNKEDVNTLKDMGISVSYNVSDGAQAVTIDEDKLRAMLDSDPDRVADLFTKSDGIMDRMKNTLDTYAKTTGEPKGILIQQSGSPLSSLSLMSNQWQTEIDNYNKQIETWQDKLESQVEKYTSQFARLEQLIQQMNSQSSTLQGMMGG